MRSQSEVSGSSTLSPPMPCHEAVGGDVDGDGDVDICSKPWSTGNEHFFLENLLKESGQVEK